MAGKPTAPKCCAAAALPVAPSARVNNKKDSGADNVHHNCHDGKHKAHAAAADAEIIGGDADNDAVSNRAEERVSEALPASQKGDSVWKKCATHRRIIFFYTAATILLFALVVTSSS